MNILCRSIGIVLLLMSFLFPIHAADAVTYEANHISWSGYWWPFTAGGLSTGKDYRGHPAPLEKYELLLNNRTSGPSISWYEDNYYQRDAEYWGGLCPSWARAAAYENYEILPSSLENIVFRVGDKKGLLTLCHDDDFYITGSGENPVEFHRWLLQYLKDEKRAFTADLSTGEQVWYYPIYRCDMQINGSMTTKNVTVKIYYAADDVHPDVIGTVEKTTDYTYTLDVNASGEIVNGDWTGQSIDRHPETMKFPVSAKARCPYLDCDEIRRIAQTRDDALEADDNASASLDPGTYHLILLDSDAYIFNGSPADTFYFEIVKKDGSAEDIEFAVYDTTDGGLVEQGVLDRFNPSFSRRLVQKKSPYKLVVTQAENYVEDPNIYTLVMDRIPAYRRHIPYVPLSSEWSGFSLTNAGDRVLENAILVAYDAAGQPRQTIFGPEDLLINEKQMLLFENLDWRAHEYGDLKSMKLMSDQAVGMVNLFAAPNSGMGGFGCEEANGSHLVIADTFYTFMGSGPYMKGGVINESFYDAAVEIRLFSSEGFRTDTIEDIIGPGRSLEITPGSGIFSRVADGGWMDIVSKNGTKLSGYQYTRDLTAKKNDINTLFALPVFKTTKYVPHVPPPVTANDWKAQLTVINPYDRENRLSFHFSRAGQDVAENSIISLAPYEKQVIDLTAEFGRMPGEAMFRSMLEIRGDFPFVGYYAFVSEASAMKDRAAFPLMDDLSFKNELVLPHVPAKNSQWWTGVGICNPNAHFVDVKAEPYGADGNVIENLVTFISLDPGAYSVFNVRLLFPGPDDISYIRFYVEDDESAVIGGFYQYGTGNVTSLSGANM